MRDYLREHRAPVGWVGAALALVVAAVYLVVVPGEAAEVDGLPHLVLTYGHALVWFLLAGAAATFALGTSARLTAGLAYAALIGYGVFLGTLILVVI